MIPILMIRHAPTAWNAEGRIQGRRDVPLSREGRERAALWRVPAGWETARRVASPLRRARETAHLMGLGKALEEDGRLVEMSWGDWEGQRLDDLRERLGAAMASNEARGLDFLPPGGESPRQVQARLLPWLLDLSGATVAITHKGIIRAMYALASGWTMTAKPRDRLQDERAHVFVVSPGGSVSIDRLNIPLHAPTGSAA